MTAPEVVEAVVLTHLAASLPHLTDTDLADVTAEWAALPGRAADTARHLIDEEFEVRQATARMRDMEVAR